MTDTGTGPDHGQSTRAVHAPGAERFTQRPVGLPVYRTAAFGFDTAAEFADVLAGQVDGYAYSRVDNPTSDAFAAAVAELEGAGVPGPVVAQPFASGMAAISTTLMAHLSAGDHVVASAALYGGTYGLLNDLLARFGVRATFVDTCDLAAVRAAVEPATVVLWAETIANPALRVADLPALAEIAHAAGALLCVDSTFASPAVCRPLEHGVDVVVHSATKYISGHSDVTGGVAVGAPAVLDPVRAARIDLGGSLSPDDAFLLHRGITTLPLRIARHCESALAFARALAAHPAVTAVRYPGLADHPDRELAGKLFDPDRFGGMVTVDIAGDRARGMKLCDLLRLAGNVSSLGGTHTVVSHVASSTHRQLDDAALAAAGIGPATVRVSVGLEDVEDLIGDFTQALDALA